MRVVHDRRVPMLAALLAVLGGCAGPLNESVGLRGAALPALSAADETTSLNGDRSLLHGFDRTDWPVVQVAVPQEQVANYPQWVRTVTWRRGHGPYDPDFPDASEALVDATDAGADLGDAATEIFVHTVMLVAVPVAGVTAGPWIVSRSPSEPYQRLPPP